MLRDASLSDGSTSDRYNYSSLVANNTCTQRNLFEILLFQPEIRLYLPLADSFATNQTTVWFQIIQKMLNTIRFRVDVIRFRKDFSVYGWYRRKSADSGREVSVSFAAIFGIGRLRGLHLSAQCKPNCKLRF